MLRGSDQARSARLERLQRAHAVAVGEIEMGEVERNRLCGRIARVFQFGNAAAKKLPIDMDEGPVIPLLYADVETHSLQHHSRMGAIRDFVGRGASDRGGHVSLELNSREFASLYHVTAPAPVATQSNPRSSIATI